MSTPKRQHFIPRSYLKNFATIEDNKDFVEVMDVRTGKISYPFSTKNVCVSKNLYTIPNVDKDDKYFLESYYATNVDGVYPEVYKMLVDENVTTISETDREKILSTTLSLFFRTSRFLDVMNAELANQINRMKQFDLKEDANLFLTFGGRRYTCKKEDIDDLHERAKIDNRLDWIIGHLEDWKNFVRHKYHSQITVLKVVGEVPLITCDNPVDIYNISGEPLDVFDPENTIQMPLDKEHYLWISHNDENSHRHLIYRGQRDKWFALTSNSTTQKNATEWLIGEHGTIQVHIDQLNKHNEDTPENWKAVEDIKILALGMEEHLTIAEKQGITSKASIDKLIELNKLTVFANNANFKRLYTETLALKLSQMIQDIQKQKRK